MKKPTNNPLLIALQGVAMSIADSVPGVSGGTIAFILGYYDRFIGAINDLVYEKGLSRARKDAFIYLVKFMIGWCCGFLVCAGILSSIFETHIYILCSLFVGFVLAAIPVIIIEDAATIKGNWWHLVFTVLGAAVVAAVAYFNLGSGSRSVDITSLSVGLGIYLFIAGAIAICAMFLPGMSGSTLLLVFGIYIPIINGIKSALKLDLSAVPAMFIFGVGVIVGALTSVRVIRICLEKFRSQTIYFIIGMLIGSVYAIILGPTTLEEPLPAMSFSTFSIAAFIVGIVIILGMQFGKTKLAGKK